MRPTLKLLDENLRTKIIDEARHLLCTLGVEIHNPEVLGLLGDHGAEVDFSKQHARFTEGINNISGPGMLDFIMCMSLEKLVLDNEICGMVGHLVNGIEPREDFPSTPIFEELIRERHLLIADHTRRYLKDEITFPGPVVDRANRARWLEEGGLSLYDRAAKEVERLVTSYTPSRLPAEVAAELEQLMTSEARRFGMERLPDRA